MEDAASMYVIWLFRFFFIFVFQTWSNCIPNLCGFACFNSIVHDLHREKAGLKNETNFSKLMSGGYGSDWIKQHSNKASSKRARGLPRKREFKTPEKLH